MTQAEAIWQIIAVAELGPDTTPPRKQAGARGAADGATDRMKLLSLAVDGIVLYAGVAAAAVLIWVALT